MKPYQNIMIKQGKVLCRIIRNISTKNEHQRYQPRCRCAHSWKRLLSPTSWKVERNKSSDLILGIWKRTHTAHSGWTIVNIFRVNGNIHCTMAQGNWGGHNDNPLSYVWIDCIRPSTMQLFLNDLWTAGVKPWGLPYKDISITLFSLWHR